MERKIRVGAVSYLNTKPLLYGIGRSGVKNLMELRLEFPARLAMDLQEGAIDVALLPVAAIPTIPGAHIISDYGIATNGNVVSVALFSRVPIAEIETVILDYQSRTSVKLAQVLLKHHWKKNVEFRHADINYIEEINGNCAGVIIGDRALMQLNNFEFVYDLSAAWKSFTGLGFVFAAWVAREPLPAGFVAEFNLANKQGLEHLDEVIAENPFPFYDLRTYYTENIKFELDAEKHAGLSRFLDYL